MKTINTNRRSGYGRIALLVVAILLSLNIIKGQDEFLSQMVKTEYKNQSDSFLLNYTYFYLIIN